jgi:hypothetical protein
MLDAGFWILVSRYLIQGGERSKSLWLQPNKCHTNIPST